MRALRVTSCRPSGRSVAVAALAWLWAACSAQIEAPPSPAPERPTGPTGPLPDAPALPPPAILACAAPPPARLRHLTRGEYANTARDLLGDDLVVTGAFPQDLRRDGFDVGIGISPLLARAYLDTAERLAERARHRATSLLGCDPAAVGEDACAASFIRSFGRRAYRRAVTEAEVEGLTRVYQAGKRAGGFGLGFQAVIQAALSSPQFYYHVEDDPPSALPGEVIDVRPHELASRLSYLLWRSMPDEALLRAAEAGRLTTPADVEAEARRLLRDPRARSGVREFFDQWLDIGALEGLEKNLERFPFFAPAPTVPDELARSLRSFVEWVLWSSGGQLETLWTSNVGYVGARLSPFFGVPVQGNALQRVTLPAAERPGLLSHPALLAVLAKPDQADPIHRGTWVRERLLCEPLPPPPPEVNVVVPEPVAGQTSRVRFARHASDPACAACHRLIDPIGFGFERYDAVGRYSPEDEAQAVDGAGEILGGGDAGGRFTGLPDLSRKVAASTTVRRCLGEQFLRFSLPEIPAATARCHLGLPGGIAASTLTFTDLVVAVVRSGAFRTRTVARGDEP